jgi:hypothetical protein
MSRMTLIIFALLLPLLSGGCSDADREAFAIRLLGQDMPTAEFVMADLGALELQDDPLLSVEDIITYDASSHEIELTAAAYSRLQQLFPTPVDVDGIPFVVTVGAERIYGGALWTPLSSLSFDGVIIPQPFDTDRQVIALVLGYPSPEVFSGRDPRGDGRILEALRAAGKIK